jgi:aminoglycoside 3-N-acetyltransferase I
MKEAFQIKKLGKQDVLIFRKLIDLFHQVFEVENPKQAEESYLANLLEKPDFIAMCVVVENELAGGLTAYELPMYYANESELFIYDIAIRPEFQKKGLGRELLKFLEKYCRQQNIRVMFVAANEEDEHALEFYHATGGKAERVVHFNYLFDSK